MRAAAMVLLLLLSARTSFAKGAADLLGWLPADTASVSGAPGTAVPLLSWLSSNFRVMEKTPPACWSKLTGGAEASFQIWRAPPDPAEALLVKGTFERATAERCLGEAFKALEQPTKLTRQGALTRMENGKLGEGWLGWGKGWIVWAPQRARVEQLLAALAKPGQAPPIAGPLGRVNLGAHLWMASTLDYTGRMLGVPSRSLVGWLMPGPSGLEMPVALEFGSEAEAERAEAALGKLAKDPKLAAPLRAVVGQLNASRRRHFVTLDLDPATWMKPEVMGALQAAVERK